ncbi:MAG: S24/S26 family peptidase [Candidatus Woesearchaeota archaeon]
MNGFEIFLVKGKSMRPLLREGDSCIVVKDKNYGLFDVVAFRRKGKVIIHRIVKFRRDGRVTTHGDNSASFFRALASFEVIRRKDIIGRVVCIVRSRRKVEGFRLKLLSFFSLVLGIFRMLPFLFKRYVFGFKPRKAL